MSTTASWDPYFKGAPAGQIRRTRGILLISAPSSPTVRNAGRKENMRNSKDPFFRQFRVAVLALALPFVMAVGPVAGYYIGSWIGAALGYRLWGGGVGLAAGTAASIQQTVLIIRRILREMK